MMLDGSVRHGWFSYGYLHGPVRGVTLKGRLNHLGQYRAGLASGCCWSSLRGGGWLVGRVCPRTGQYTGPEIAFLYPDLKTALVGKFQNGTLVSGREARLSGLDEESGVLVPTFRATSYRHFSFSPSTRDAITVPPLQQDPYESTLVEVGASSLEGGGECLYARRDIPAGTLIAYYNGIRLGPGEKTPYHDTGYAIYVEWKRKRGQKGDHMDIPPDYQQSTNYVASLAHKLNHSFTPNCEWINADHPVFGFVPAVATIQDVAAGEEVTAHYSMDMEDAPQWYMDSWDLHSNLMSHSNTES